MPIPTWSAPSSGSRRCRRRSLKRAKRKLPSANPQRKVVSIAVNAYVELPMKKVSARVQITSYDSAAHPARPKLHSTRRTVLPS